MLSLQCQNWHILCKDILVNGTVRFLLRDSWCRKGHSGGTGYVHLMHNYSKQLTNLPVNKPDLTAHDEELQTRCVF